MESTGTCLNFLMRDGAIRVTFMPALSPAQYTELHAMVAKATDKDALKAEIHTAAQRWQVTVSCEGY